MSSSSWSWPSSAGRWRGALRFDAASARALVFTGATRNSLVVLPLALALGDAYALTAAVIVTQTLVEVLGMVVYVRWVPRLVPAGRALPAARARGRGEDVGGVERTQPAAALATVAVEQHGGGLAGDGVGAPRGHRLVEQDRRACAGDGGRRTRGRWRLCRGRRSRRPRARRAPRRTAARSPVPRGCRPRTTAPRTTAASACRRKRAGESANSPSPSSRATDASGTGRAGGFAIAGRRSLPPASASARPTAASRTSDANSRFTASASPVVRASCR